jgi:hypothetical protein
MKTCTSLAALVFAIASTPPAAVAFPPGWCSREYAASDFKKSDLVIIGRVTSVERVIASSEKDKDRVASYFAIITVGQASKGDVKPGNRVAICLGSGDEPDDVTPSGLVQYNSHAPLPLEISKVYLLCLVRDTRKQDEGDRSDDITISDTLKTIIQTTGALKPRSCHASVSEIVRMDSEGWPIGVRLGKGLGRIFGSKLEEEKTDVTIPLSDYLKQKQEDLKENAGKGETPDKTESK